MTRGDEHTPVIVINSSVLGRFVTIRQGGGCMDARPHRVLSVRPTSGVAAHAGRIKGVAKDLASKQRIRRIVRRCESVPVD